jgi:nitrogen fixation/metabolism regulation signal transduction histidine kinase
MPFFDSEEQLKAEQRDILSNILNAFTFIFVIFILLSFLASRILTYPFKYLTQKIKSTTLSTLNEPLEWQADDEIGLMVREYNKMLLNLEKSRKALALSEKESAWREMAQQVAHEIKNPLTPMKLKLQHLKRVLSEVPTEVSDFNKPIDSLLNQVDILSDIATSFSTFAKMPIPISERLDLIEELRKSVGLFKGNEIEIKTNIPKQPVWVLGDAKLLGRIFNNLILNAEQSVPEEREGELSIELILTHNKVRITVEDNGSGIPDDIKEKIFIPKFSTKEEGSGIGLAIAKRGVEHAGGSIWFDSTLGKGTTFYLEFPLTD